MENTSESIRRFYDIQRYDDGSCTVTLFDARKMTNEDGETDWEMAEYSMPVQWFAEIDENIREHYRAWVAHARAYCAQREAFERALAAVLAQNKEV